MMNGNDMTAGIVGMMLARKQGLPPELQNAALVRGMVKDKTAALVLEDRGYKRIGELVRERDDLQLRVVALESQLDKKSKTLIDAITGSKNTPPLPNNTLVKQVSGWDLDKILRVEHVAYYGLSIITLLMYIWARKSGVASSLFNKIGAGVTTFGSAVGNIFTSPAGMENPSTEQLNSVSAALEQLATTISELAQAIKDMPSSEEDPVVEPDPIEPNG